MNPYYSKCLICGSSDIKELNRYKHANLVKCRKCKLVFCRKKSSDSELTKYYSNYPVNYCNSQLTLKRYNKLLDIFEKFRINNNIIDVGCGDGFFLEAAKERGWNVYGTEFSNEKVTICINKGINIIQGKLDPNNYDKNCFDVIISIEVLEHINYPVKEIFNFHKILRKKGALYITTPNFQSLSRLILKDKWNIIVYPEHLCYYTPDVICNLLTNIGFKMISLQTTGISFSRMQAGFHTDNNNSSSSGKLNDEKIRQILENNRLLWLAKKIVNQFLNVFKIGDTIKVIVVKY